MNSSVIVDKLLVWYQKSWGWIKTEVLVSTSLGQLAIIGLALLLGLVLGRPLGRWLEGLVKNRPWADKPFGKGLTAFIGLTAPLTSLFLLAVADNLAATLDWPSALLHTAVTLTAAWTAIRLSTLLVPDPKWAKAIAVGAMVLAGLNILGLLSPAMDLMDSLAVKLGTTRISLLTLVKGIIILGLALKFASLASAMTEKKVKGLEALTPSIQVLLGKVFRVSIYIFAVLISMSSVGIDLTALAFFSGAIGLGVGFGLQKVVSNLVSGIILLADRSIKPGDLVALDKTVGQVRLMGARYVSVITRDGTEYLIPNEDLITNRVINWSFTDRLVRLKINVGVAYETDIRAARQLIIDTAAGVKRVLKTPAPVCHLVDFGDSSVDLQLRVWVEDPEKGLANVSSELRLEIWDAFAEAEIEIPFPQRDLHIKPLEQLNPG